MNITKSNIIDMIEPLECDCTNYEISDEEIVDGCCNDAVVTFKETCKDCGSVTYGYEITSRDGDIIDGDGSFATREEAKSRAINSDSSFIGENYSGYDSGFDYDVDVALNNMDF